MNLSRGSGGTPGGLPAAAPPYIVYVPLGPRPSPHRHPPKSEARTTTGLVRRVCEEGPCRSTDTAPLAFPSGRRLAPMKARICVNGGIAMATPEEAVWNALLEMEPSLT